MDGFRLPDYIQWHYFHSLFGCGEHYCRCCCHNSVLALMKMKTNIIDSSVAPKSNKSQHGKSHVGNKALPPPSYITEVGLLCWLDLHKKAHMLNRRCYGLTIIRISLSSIGLRIFTLAVLRCWAGAKWASWASLLMAADLLEVLLRAEGVSTSNSCLLFCSSYSSFDFLTENESGLLYYLGQLSL